MYALGVQFRGPYIFTLPGLKFNILGLEPHPRFVKIIAIWLPKTDAPYYIELSKTRSNRKFDNLPYAGIYNRIEKALEAEMGLGLYCNGPK